MASPSRSLRYGPIPRWGPEPRTPCKIHWPREHRERYETEASEAGLSLNEYVIRVMARVHGLPGPREEHDTQIALGA